MLGIDLAAIRAEMETEREWRETELRFLKNHISSIDNEEKGDIARKSLVVMLYAHFEGLCRALIAIYVATLNRTSLTLAQAHSALVAVALNKLFEALYNPYKKCTLFSRDLPNDVALHRYAREREFIESSGAFGQFPLSIDAERIVNTEGNLKPAVLRRILYQLGLDPDIVLPWMGTIYELVQRRNDVAHGTARSGISAKKYTELEEAVRKVVDGLMLAISDSISKQQYLSSPGSHLLSS